MSIKIIKSLKSENNLERSPSFEFYKPACSSLKNVNSYSIHEKLTLLQKNLEETQINFLGEKQQKLEKLTQIHELFEKNQGLNKKVIEAVFKINKKNDENKRLKIENSKIRRLIEEIGVDYDKSEPLLNKIMLFETKLNEKDKEIQSLNEVLIKKDEEISEKRKELEEMEQILSKNEDLQAEIKKKDKSLKYLSAENISLKTLLHTSESNNENNSKMNIEKISLLERDNKEINSKYEELNIEYHNNKNLVENLTSSLVSSEIQLSEFQQIKTLKSQLENDSRKKDKDILILKKNIIEINEKMKPFILNKNETIRNLLCRFCRDPIEEAITVIPCGHSYCLKCENGYNSSKCKSCGCTIEAVYKNELMNEMKKWFMKLTS